MLKYFPINNMVIKRKGLDEYPKKLIDNLGKYTDKQLAEEFKYSPPNIARLRHRLNIPSYNKPTVLFDIDKFPNDLIDKLGKDYDSHISKEFDIPIITIRNLRNRLNIPSYLSTLNKLKELTCAICGKEFKRRIRSRKKTPFHFCSHKCKYEWQKRKRIYITCDNCKAEIFITPSDFEFKHHFCNESCQHEWNKGENAWNFCGYPDRVYGKGWKLIRNEVIERDKICRSCKNEYDSLDVHHIIPFKSSEDNSINNLISLCKGCHRLIEHLYFKLETRPQYFELINSMRYGIR